MALEGLADISKMIENENKNYNQIYNRLVKMCDSIMNIDKFQFDLSKFSKAEVNESCGNIGRGFCKNSLSNH